MFLLSNMYFLINYACASDCVPQTNLHIVNNLPFTIAIGFNEPGSQVSVAAASGDTVKENQLCLNTEYYIDNNTTDPAFSQNWRFTAFSSTDGHNSGITKIYDGSISINCTTDQNYEGGYCETYLSYNISPASGQPQKINAVMSLDENNTPTLTLSR